MKKISVFLIAVGLLVSMSGYAKAADTASFFLVVTVVNAGIGIQGPTGYVGTGDAVLAGASLVTDKDHKSDIRNIGSTTIDLQLSAVTETGSASKWAQRTDAPTNALLANEYRLGGIFTQWDRAVAEGDFAATDIFQNTLTLCSETTHALDSEADSFKAIDIAPGAIRNLHYLFQAPDTVDNPGEMLIEITITAIAAS